jgi:hypothetical protein
MEEQKSDVVTSVPGINQSSLAVLALLGYFLVLFVPERSVLSFGAAWFWLYDALLFVFFPVALALVTARAFSLSVENLGLRIRTSEILGFVTQCAAMVLLFWLVLYAGYLLGASVANRFPEFLPRTFTYTEVLPESQPWRSYAAIYLAVTAGFAQEIMFRGIPLAVLSNVDVRNKLAWYLVISSLGFAAWHWDKGLATVTAAAAVGLAAGLAFWKQRNLLALVVAHVAVDLYWLS